MLRFWAGPLHHLGRQVLLGVVGDAGSAVPFGPADQSVAVNDLSVLVEPGVALALLPLRGIDAPLGLGDGTIDFFYIDPPFNTGKVQSAHAGSYQDSWETTDAWVEWFTLRIKATIPKIKQAGSVLIHVD